MPGKQIADVHPCYDAGQKVSALQPAAECGIAPAGLTRHEDALHVHVTLLYGVVDGCVDASQRCRAQARTRVRVGAAKVRVNIVPIGRFAQARQGVELVGIAGPTV